MFNKLYAPVIYILILLSQSIQNCAYSATRTVYGLEQAKHFTSKTADTYLISLGVFVKQANAKRVAQSVHLTNQAMLHITFQKGLYHVMIGPLASVNEVRTIGRQLSNPIPPSHAPKSHGLSKKSSHVGNSPRHSESRRDEGSPKDSTVLVALSLGPAWDTTHQAKTVYLDYPQIFNTYTATEKDNVLAQGELFLGWQVRRLPSMLSQTGLAIARTTHTRKQGEVWTDGSSAFNNATYRYKVYHEHVAVKEKLIFDPTTLFIPFYIGGSAGLALNHAGSFTNTPLIVEEVAASNFGTKTVPAFTYTLEAGIQKPLNDHFSLGLGYEFSDWGQYSLGLAAGQIKGMGEQLSSSHLYTHALMLNLTYLR